MKLESGHGLCAPNALTWTYLAIIGLIFALAAVLAEVISTSRSLESAAPFGAKAHLISVEFYAAENSFNDYLLTGQKPFLAEFETQVTALADTVTQLEKLTELDSVQAAPLARVRNEFKTWLAYSQRVIQAKRRGDALTPLLEKAPERANDESIHALIEDLLGSAELQKARLANRSRMILTALFALAATLLVLLIVSLNWLFYRKQSVKRARLTRNDLSRKIIEAVTDYAIVMLDAEGRITSWNSGAKEILGYDSEEVIGLSFETLHTPEDRMAGKPQSLVAEAMRLGRAHDIGLRLRKDGTRLFAEVFITTIRDENGKIIGFTKVSRDLTEWKRLEHGREAQLDAELALNSNLEAVVNRSVIIADAVTEHVGDLDAMLKIVTEHACALVGADFCGIGMQTPLSPRDDRWIFVGVGENFAVGRDAVAESPGLLGLATKLGQTIRCDDVSKSPAYKDIPVPDGHPEIGAFLAVPVRCHKKATGNLYLAKEVGKGVFTEQDQHYIELLVEFSAVAIRNTLLYSTIEHERNRFRMISEFSSALVGPLDMKAILGIIPNSIVPEFADFCSVELIENNVLRRMGMACVDTLTEGHCLKMIEDGTMVVSADSPHPSCRAIQERKPLLLQLDDGNRDQLAYNAEHLKVLQDQKPKSGMWVPIMLQDQPVGVLCFTSHSKAFQNDHLEVANELARRTALSIENIRLFEETKIAVIRREETMAVVSHDLKNPITAIKLSSEILRRCFEQEAGRSSDLRQSKIYQTMKNGLRTLDSSATLAIQLIQDLLDFAQLESGALHLEIGCRPVGELFVGIRDVMKTIADAKSIDLQFELLAADADILCDLNKISQVLSNLVGNAIKFSAPGACVRVRSEWHGDQILFSVSDTGPGIGEESLLRIFDRYWRPEGSTVQGIGLGLSIAKGIVEAHHGKIWCESRLGEGSSFYFVLPAGIRRYEHLKIAL